MIYSKVIQVADIIIKIESSFDFKLGYKYEPFLSNNNMYDVLIKIKQKKIIDFDIKNYNETYQGETYSIISNGVESIRIRKKSKSSDIEYYTRKLDENLYEINFIKNEGNESIRFLKPLEMVNLEEILLTHNCGMLHSSIIKYNNQGVVFTAPSGTGKTTQANLWNEFYNADILNGDRTIIKRVDNSAYRGYGSPYAGSSCIYKNENVKLSIIIILKQAKENRLRKALKKEAYLHLISQTSICSYEKELIDKQLTWVGNLINDVPIYILECLPNKEAVDLVLEKLGELKNGTE